MISRLHLNPCQGVLPVPIALPPHVSGAAPPVVPTHCQLLQLQLDLEVVQLHLGSQLSQIHAYCLQQSTVYVDYDCILSHMSMCPL